MVSCGGEDELTVPLESIVDTTPLHGGRCVSSFVWSCEDDLLFAGLPFEGRSVERSVYISGYLYTIVHVHCVLCRLL